MREKVQPKHYRAKKGKIGWHFDNKEKVITIQENLNSKVIYYNGLIKDGYDKVQELTKCHYANAMALFNVL